MIKSNCHTHTLYCDGKNSAEEMILSAIEKGFVSLGFSGHSPMNFENDWAMKEQELSLYVDEVRSLKRKYAKKIDVLCGIELDADHIGVNLNDYDYVIASVHQFHDGDRVYSIDYTAEELTRCVNEMFGGSWNQMAENYYALVSKHVLSGEFDIVGHIDLITKFNDNGNLFDENDPEYQKFALKAVDDIIDERPDILFEINTGAMYRCGNKRPYPAEFILRHIFKRGGRITITSDAHCCEALDFAFIEALQYCKKCGFNCAYVIKSDGKEKIYF